MSWEAVSQGLCRCLPEPRQSEMSAHLADAEDSGVPIGIGVTASILGMVLRVQAVRLGREIPMILAGLPFVLLCLVNYGLVYEAHFTPWDLMEETASQGPGVAILRRVIGVAWLVMLPIALLAGWRAARRLRAGSLLLPTLFVGALTVAVPLSVLFEERNDWYGRPLRESDVDEVSAHSLFMISVAFLLPAAYLVADRLLVRREVVMGRRGGIQIPVHKVGGLLGLLAVMTPLVMVFGSPLWVPSFLLFLWVAPSFALRHKVVGTVVAFGAFELGLTVASIFFTPGDAIAIAESLLHLLTWMWLTRAALSYWWVSRSEEPHREIVVSPNQLQS